MPPHDSLMSRLQPGTRLDRFELLGLVARGGMAEVWLARLVGPHGVERLFAVKTMLPQLIEDPSLHKLFIDEARIACRIDHPNVARLHELGEIHGEPYVVMDWIDGDPMSVVLTQLGESTVLPPGITCRIIADACAGLHAAHELRDADGELLGVVHRDISPSNILVDRHGVARVIDFGIARARDRLSERTATGVVRGKLSYMSREQAQGAMVDRRSDVWAMGAVLHHLLASRHPFEGKTPLENVRMVLDGIPATALPDTVPERIREVAARALDHDLETRIQSAASMRQMLLDAMGESGLHTTTDDVAEFVGELLKHRRAERAEFVAAALESARGRAERESAAPEPSREPRATPAAAPAPSHTASPAQALTPANTPSRGHTHPKKSRSHRHSRPSSQSAAQLPPKSTSRSAPRRTEPKRTTVVIAWVGAIALLTVAVVIWLTRSSTVPSAPLPQPVRDTASIPAPSAPVQPSSSPIASSPPAPAPSPSAMPRLPTTSGSGRSPAPRSTGSSWMRDYGF